MCLDSLHPQTVINQDVARHAKMKYLLRKIEVMSEICTKEQGTLQLDDSDDADHFDQFAFPQLDDQNIGLCVFVSVDCRTMSRISPRVALHELVSVFDRTRLLSESAQ
jgi:hypothetical protein